MVRVQGDRIAVHRPYRHDDRLLALLHPKLAPLFELEVGRELSSRQLHRQLVAARTIGLRGWNRHPLLVADDHARHGVVEALDHGAFAQRERQRVETARAVEFLTVVECARVVDPDGVAPLRLRHASPVVFSGNQRVRECVRGLCQRHRVMPGSELVARLSRGGDDPNRRKRDGSAYVTLYSITAYEQMSGWAPKMHWTIARAVAA